LGVWGLGLGPKPQTPNPQSPNPQLIKNKIRKYKN